jgi:catechol 2,3-dioxygenase-like lactoylglutathione lyase family enzyme
MISSMKTKGIDHIHFTVTDLEKAIEFYKVLGLTIAKSMDHGGDSAQMTSENGGIVIDLHQARNIDNPGYNHYAIKVEDIDRACDELMEKGFAVDGPVYVEATKRKLATIRDPNGILVQLVESTMNIEKGIMNSY